MESMTVAQLLEMQEALAGMIMLVATGVLLAIMLDLKDITAYRRFRNAKKPDHEEFREYKRKRSVIPHRMP